MAIRNLRLASVLVLGTASMFVLPFGPMGASAQNIDSKVDAASDKLDEATRDVSAAQSRLRDVQDRLDDAREELDDVRQTVESAEESERAAKAALARAEAAVAKTQGEVVALRARIEELKSAVGAWARRIYTQGGSYSELEILMSSDDPGDFAALLKALDSVSKESNNALLELARTKAQLAKKLDELQSLELEAEQRRKEAHDRYVEAVQAREAALRAKQRLVQLSSQRAEALEDARGDRDEIKLKYDALRAEQARIAAAAAAARLNSGGGSGGGGGSGAGVPGTGLYWPVPGAGVVGGVGPRIHPVYGYRSCHTGVDLSAGSGAAIHATDEGRVVSTSSGGPYGNHTLIAHGDGLASMYAHQSSFAVSPGQWVRRGQVIGYVGSTGWSTGPHLHFEIHVNGTPYNPMGWFGGSRSPVSC